MRNRAEEVPRGDPFTQRHSQEEIRFPETGPVPRFAFSTSPEHPIQGSVQRGDGKMRVAVPPSAQLAPGGRRRLSHKGKSLLAQE